MKICSMCKIAKSSSEFHKNNNTKDGLLLHCIECGRIKAGSKTRRKFTQKQYAELIEKGTKYCAKCDSVKELNRFHKDSSNKNGYGTTCKDCDRLLKNVKNPYKYNYNERRDLLKDNKKYCNGCSSLKPLSKFSKNNLNASGYKSQCKDCDYSKSKKKELQIYWPCMSEEEALVEYSRLSAEQNDLCLICHQPEDRKTPKGESTLLSVDHCHTTGEVRGLLCANCNVGLGNFKDNSISLGRAIEYLTKGIK